MPHLRSRRERFVLVELYNWCCRYENGSAAIVPMGLVLSAIVVLLLLFTGWKGWEMVYHHRVGVADATQRDTPDIDAIRKISGAVFEPGHRSIETGDWESRNLSMLAGTVAGLKGLPGIDFNHGESTCLQNICWLV
jgi:hypothetical protein